MKKYNAPEMEIVRFDVTDAVNFGDGDNEQPIDGFSEDGGKMYIPW